MIRGCGICDSTGFQTVDPKDLGEPAVVRPCHLCRPEQFALWQRGAYRPTVATRPVKA